MSKYSAIRVFPALILATLLTAPGVLSGEAVELSNGTVLTPTFRAPWPPPRFQSGTSGTVNTNAAGLPLSVIGSRSFGTLLPFTLVGSAPLAGAVSTTVPTVIIPVKANFLDGTGSLDPSSIVQLTVDSPVFAPVNFDSVAPGLGTTQFGDAGQRAQFWQTVNPNGSAPDYHVLLGTPQIRPLITIDVPAASGTVATTRSGVKIGIVDSNFWSSAIFSLVQSSGVTPDQLPILLSINVGLQQGNSCCILGYHTSTSDPPAMAQTWIWASWLPPVIFAGPEDVTPLSHEVSEWLNDPLPGAPFGSIPGVNFVAPYVLPGQNGACMSIFETGDVVEALPNGVFSMRGVNGFTYHLQDVAFLWYFLRTTPSPAINGRYTLNGIFSSPATLCGPG